MMNFYCLKVGTRYDTKFVTKLDSMIKRNYRAAYNLTCITDDKSSIPSWIDTLDMPYLGVQKWWNKMILFNEEFVKEGVFFDLDIVISNDINNIHKPDQFMRFLKTDWVNLEQLRQDTIGNHQRYCSINSSVLSWDENTKRHHIWEYFNKNVDKITSIFTGIDSFIEHRFPNDYSLYNEKFDQIHIFLDKKQDEVDSEWIRKTWI